MLAQICSGGQGGMETVQTSQEEEPSCWRLSKAAAGAGSHSAVQSHPLGPSRCPGPSLALPRGVGDRLSALRGDPAGHQQAAAEFAGGGCTALPDCCCW